MDYSIEKKEESVENFIEKNSEKISSEKEDKNKDNFSNKKHIKNNSNIQSKEIQQNFIFYTKKDNEIKYKLDYSRNNSLNKLQENIKKNNFNKNEKLNQPENNSFYNIKENITVDENVSYNLNNNSKITKDKNELHKEKLNIKTFSNLEQKINKKPNTRVNLDNSLSDMESHIRSSLEPSKSSSTQRNNQNYLIKPINNKYCKLPDKNIERKLIEKKIEEKIEKNIKVNNQINNTLNNIELNINSDKKQTVNHIINSSSNREKSQNNKNSENSISEFKLKTDNNKIIDFTSKNIIKLREKESVKKQNFSQENKSLKIPEKNSDKFENNNTNNLIKINSLSPDLIEISNILSKKCIKAEQNKEIQKIHNQEDNFLDRLLNLNKSNLNKKKSINLKITNGINMSLDDTKNINSQINKEKKKIPSTNKNTVKNFISEKDINEGKKITKKTQRLSLVQNNKLDFFNDKINNIQNNNRTSIKLKPMSKIKLTFDEESKNENNKKIKNNLENSANVKVKDQDKNQKKNNFKKNKIKEEIKKINPPETIDENKIVKDINNSYKKGIIE